MRLDFGGLDLISADGGYDGYAFKAVGESLDFGEPQPVEVSVASLMADGSPTSTDRWENREAGFTVVVEAADSVGLAAGEAALMSVIGTRTTLEWTPPDGFGPTTVFPVETSSMKFLFSDLDEVRSVKRRTYQVRVVCLPWVRSLDPVTVGSEFVADAVTVKDACESITGWSTTGVYSGTFTVDSTAGNFVSGTGAVKLISTPYTYTGSNYVTGNYAKATTAVHKPLSIDASGGGYLVMYIRTDWTLDVSNMDVHITTSGGGKQPVPTVVAQAAVNGFTKLAWPVPDASTVTGWDANIWQSRVMATGSQPPNPAIRFDQIGLSAAAGGAQSARVFDVEGSVRSEGSISISAEVGLGDVLLYTARDLGDGFRPDLRRWQTGGTTGTDTASATGTYSQFGTAATIEAPLSIFRPGAYAIMAQVAITGGVTSSPITVAAQAEINGTLIGSPQSTSATWAPAAYGTYYVVNVGTLDLPPVVMDDATVGKVKFTVSGAASAAVRLGELLAFPLDEAAMTWVSCGTGTPGPTVASRLWLDEPSPSQPRGALRVGTDQFRADARAVVPKSRGRHLLYPGSMFAYLLTSASGGAALSTTYFPRWHSNAGS